MCEDQFFEGCVETILESRGTPCFLFVVYLVLSFLSLGHYVGSVRFCKAEYGEAFVDAYLAFSIIGCVSYCCVSAVLWVWAAKFANKAHERSRKVLLGLLAMFVAHDCPFFFMELTLKLTPSLAIHMRRYEDFIFSMAIVSFSISFFPAWLYILKIMSQYVEECCRNEDETVSFEHEELYAGGDNEASMFDWQRAASLGVISMHAYRVHVRQMQMEEAEKMRQGVTHFGHHTTTSHSPNHRRSASATMTQRQTPRNAKQMRGGGGGGGAAAAKDDFAALVSPPKELLSGELISDNSPPIISTGGGGGESGDRGGGGQWKTVTSPDQRRTGGGGGDDDDGTVARNRTAVNLWCAETVMSPPKLVVKRLSSVEPSSPPVVAGGGGGRKKRGGGDAGVEDNSSNSSNNNGRHDHNNSDDDS